MIMADKFMDDQIQEKVTILISKGYLNNGTGTTSADFEHNMRNQIHGVLLARQRNDKGQSAQPGDFELIELPVMAKEGGQQISFPFNFKLEIDSRKLTFSSMSVQIGDGKPAHLPLE